MLQQSLITTEGTLGT